MLSSQEIYAKVKRVLVDALDVDDEDVKPQAAIHRDLGAESIDLLDIVFRLERGFKLRIPREELFPDSILREDAEFVREGLVTDKGMAELRARLPYAELSDFDRDRRVSAITEVFTVDLVIRYIAWKLAQTADAEALPVSAPAAALNMEAHLGPVAQGA